MIIGYFADGPWSHRALEKLLSRNEHTIAFVCARYNNSDLFLKNIADNRGIPFLLHPNVNDSDFLKRISSYRCNLFISMSFNQIFHKNIINIPTLGAINCHAGKLPFYRGRNVLNWVLINDESEFGVTVHYIDEGIDTGDIILQKCFPITDSDTYRTILERAYEACALLLDQAVVDISSGNVKRVSQSEIHPLGFYCAGRAVGDEVINWNWPSRQIFNFVRAISDPGPLARTHKDENELKISAVEYISSAPSYIGIAGSIIAKDKNSFFVKTGDSYIKLVKWEGDIKLKVGDRLK